MTREATIAALVVVPNVEVTLEDCLKRLGWVDDIVVVLENGTDESKKVVDKYKGRIVECSWKTEGLSRNSGIDFCRADWILEIDTDEWVTSELAEEIRETISDPYYDVYKLKVNNYIGGKLITNGWGVGLFGNLSYIGLFKKGAKLWGSRRMSPDITVTGKQAPNELKNPVISRKYENVSGMLGQMDCFTTLRAKDLVENGEISSLVNSFGKFLYRFFEIYFRYGSYKEGGYGFMLALCTGLYPLVSNIKAIYEETSVTEAINTKIE